MDSRNRNTEPCEPEKQYRENTAGASASKAANTDVLAWAIMDMNATVRHAHAVLQRIEGTEQQSEKERADTRPTVSLVELMTNGPNDIRKKCAQIDEALGAISDSLF